MVLYKNKSKEFIDAERASKVLDMRRQGMSYRAIGAELGFSDYSARKCCLKYLQHIDEENLQKAKALRAEEFELMDAVADKLKHAIFVENDLSQVQALVRVSENKRKLYALDVEPVRRAEIQFKKTVVVELMGTLQTALSPSAYAEVINVLAADVDAEPGNEVDDPASCEEGDAAGGGRLESEGDAGGAPGSEALGEGEGAC